VLRLLNGFPVCGAKVSIPYQLKVTLPSPLPEVLLVIVKGTPFTVDEPALLSQAYAYTRLPDVETSVPAEMFVAVPQVTACDQA
jgi:hypothetical protein